MISKRMKLVLFLLGFLTLHLTPYTLHVCYASFEDMSFGARAMGMGGAFLAVADDAGAVLSNPAGIAQLKRPEILVSGAYLFHKSGDSLYGYFGYVHPIQKLGNLGIGYYNRGINLYQRFREGVLGASYSRPINSYTSIGVGLKMCSKEYPDSFPISNITGDDYYRNRFPYGLSADIAVFLFNIPQLEKLNFALACTDIGAGTLGFRGGLAYKFDDLKIFSNVTASVDFAARSDGFKFNLGGEAWFRQTEAMKKVMKDNLLGVRMGMKFGDSGDFTYAVGGGIKSNYTEKTDWKLDFALTLPYHSSAEFFTGGFWVSLSLLFGDADRWEKEEQARLDEEKRIADEMNSLLAEKRKFEDEKKKWNDDRGRLEDEKKRLEDEKKRLEDEKRKLEEAQKNAMEELKKLRGVTVKEDKEKIIIVATETAINFASGSPEILRGSYVALDQIAKALQAYSKTAVMVEGHTDNVPIGSRLKSKYKNNLELSQARAESVGDYLARQGVDESRLVKKGYGDKKPAEDNKTPEGRAANRRVEITIQK